MRPSRSQASCSCRPARGGRARSFAATGESRAGRTSRGRGTGASEVREVSSPRGRAWPSPMNSRAAATASSSSSSSNARPPCSPGQRLHRLRAPRIGLVLLLGRSVCAEHTLARRPDVHDVETGAVRPEGGTHPAGVEDAALTVGQVDDEALLGLRREEVARRDRAERVERARHAVRALKRRRPVDAQRPVHRRSERGLVHASQADAAARGR